MKLSGKVALVTGASSGIGRASAIALAKEGADIALNYLTMPESAETAKKEKRASAVYFYFTTNEKENPYSQSDWSTRTIAANTLLAITDGNNEWMNAEWNRYGKASSRTLKVTKRDDSAGVSKSSANSSYGSKISSLKQVVELADRAYCLDLDILRARYFFMSIVPLLFLRTILKRDLGRQIKREEYKQNVSINPIINTILLFISRLENKINPYLVNFFGGSLLVIAKKK